MPAELLPQPPPGVSAPPPGEVAKKSRRRLWWIIGLGLGSVLALVLVSPMFLRNSHHHGCDMISPISNAKQIGLALFDFESQYGKYPDATTSAAVKTQTGSTWTLGDTTSNDLFQQLIVSGISQSEEMFYAKTPWTKKPDNAFATETQALASGECGFAYIVGLSSSGDPQTPICVAPLEPGKLTFDLNATNGEAIILRIDNSAASYPIDKSGHVILNGMDLFDPRQSFWRGKAPNVKWPK